MSAKILKLKKPQKDFQTCVPVLEENPPPRFTNSSSPSLNLTSSAYDNLATDSPPQYFNFKESSKIRSLKRITFVIKDSSSIPS